jgi:predicted permease
VWGPISIAAIAALISLVAYWLFAKLIAPHEVTRRQIIGLNVACVTVAMLFALCLDTHGPAAFVSYVIAALEPIVLRVLLFLGKSQESKER